MQERQNLVEKLTLLVVDDEEGMRLGVERALKNYTPHFNDLDCSVEYRVELASTGEEAVEKFKNTKYDILLLDYKLPGINGIEVLEKCIKHNPATSVIMITAYASLDIAVSATKQGADDFLPKPFTPQELRASLRGITKGLMHKRRAEKLAEEKKKVRFEFISVLSHELKAPIGAVEGYLRLIQAGTINDQQMMDKVVGRSIARLDGMRKLIFDLLDLTRIEAGTKSRNFEDLDIIQIINESLELMEIASSERNIKIKLNTPESVMFNCDRGEIEIIINNLISNGIKYNKTDGELFITVTLLDGAINLEFKDTGIGLKENEVKKLFGEFVRIKNESTVAIEGSGLGLSTVKKIVQLYKGEISVKSVWTEGTVFTVNLPV